MIVRVLLGICAALLLAVLGLGWYAKSATERAAVATGQADSYRQALEIQNDRLADYDAKLLVREQSRRDAERRAADWQRRWEDALNEQPNADWAAARLPAVAAGRVRELSRPDPDQPAPDVPPLRTDTAAVLRRPDE